MGQNLDKGKRVQRVSTPFFDDISFTPPNNNINIAPSDVNIAFNVFVLVKNYILMIAWYISTPVALRYGTYGPSSSSTIDFLLKLFRSSNDVDIINMNSNYNKFISMSFHKDALAYWVIFISLFPLDIPWDDYITCTLIASSHTETYVI